MNSLFIFNCFSYLLCCPWFFFISFSSSLPFLLLLLWMFLIFRTQQWVASTNEQMNDNRKLIIFRFIHFSSSLLAPEMGNKNENENNKECTEWEFFWQHACVFSSSFWEPFLNFCRCIDYLYFQFFSEISSQCTMSICASFFLFCPFPFIRVCSAWKALIIC